MSASSGVPSTAELTVSRAKDEIIKEAKRIEEDALYSSKGHFAAAQVWSNFHLWVGLPTALLAGVAAVSALSQFDSRGIAAGIISIAVGGLTAVNTFMNPNERASIHLNAGNNYDALMNRTRIFWTIGCWLGESDDVLTSRLKDLSDEKDKLNKSCPQIPGWAYKAAKRGILAGEAVHSVDKEA
jgi:hypothetical protein